jgi:protein TonB
MATALATHRPTLANLQGTQAKRERWLVLLVIAGAHVGLIAWLLHAGIVPRQKALEVLQAFLVVPQKIEPRLEQPAPPKPERTVRRTTQPVKPVTPPPISAPAEAPSPVVATPPAPVEVKSTPPAAAPAAPPLAVEAPRFDADYLDNPKPAYPVSSRRRGEEGRVVLRVHVNAGGRAAKVEVQMSSGHSPLDEAAVAAVSRWRFVPARRGSEAIADWVRVPIVFSLKD